jgi:tRNA1(Val) A37 N6-methylase TrmN6
LKQPAAGPADVTDDAFLGGDLRVLQPNEGYRAGIDALLLAAAAPLRSGRRERVLDVGAGVGVVGLAVARRARLCDVTLVEREPFLVELARRNIARNGLAARVRVITADVARRLDELPELRPQAEGFDHVLANPPYHRQGSGTVSGAALKAAANVMPGGALASWARFMAAMTRPGGSATLIHRADAVGEVLAALAGRFGGLIVFPLYPREGKSATRVLVQGMKGSNAPIELLPGLVLHDRGNRFQPQVEAVLRHGASLALAQPTKKPERKGAARS